MPNQTKLFQRNFPKYKNIELKMKRYRDQFMDNQFDESKKKMARAQQYRVRSMCLNRNEEKTFSNVKYKMNRKKKIMK